MIVSVCSILNNRVSNPLATLCPTLSLRNPTDTPSPPPPNITQVGRDNPAELKAQKLARSLTRGVAAHDLRPDTEERRAINTILLYPPNRPLSTDDMALLWRFRYSLVSDKRALTKFLKCVDWSDAQEAKQAAELMAQWEPIDVADALELLSPDFTNEEVYIHTSIPCIYTFIHTYIHVYV